MPDFSLLETQVVRRFTDEESGSDWTRLRQSGPSVPDAAGGMVTPGPAEVPFRAFVDEGGAKVTLKQPAGDVADGSLTLYTCQTQAYNGLEEDVDFTAANERTGVRGDTLRREDTGELWEVQAATLHRPARFWVLGVRLVQDG